jgi:phosphoribosyl-AMP cyclohydrolase
MPIVTSHQKQKCFYKGQKSSNTQKVKTQREEAKINIDRNIGARAAVG